MKSSIVIKSYRPKRTVNGGGLSIKDKIALCQIVAYAAFIVWILFFSSAAWGQDTSKTFTLPQDGGTVPVPRSIIYPVWTEPQRPITLSDLSQFLEECWNDSTAVRVHFYPNDTRRYCTITGDGCADPSHHKTVYTHRLENASAMEVLREFEKWMKKRIKP